MILLPLALLVAGCAMPISVPLAPFMGTAEESASEAPFVTGSVGARFEEDGIADRLGAQTWSALRPALARAVEGADDGDSFAWRSADGFGGTVISRSAYFGDAGELCRQVIINGPEFSDPMTAEACRGEGRQWRVRPVAAEA